MTSLPSTVVTKSRARSWVCWPVSSDGTSSTSFSTGTGLKKCTPMTCSGRLVAMPSFMIGIDEVFDAKIASGSSTTLSSAVNTSVLTCSFSATASTTRLRSAKSATSVVNRIRSSAASRSDSDSLPLRTPRPSEVAIRAFAASVAPRSTSAISTSRPARAHTSAIPEPISPDPTTPTR